MLFKHTVHTNCMGWELNTHGDVGCLVITMTENSSLKSVGLKSMVSSLYREYVPRNFLDQFCSIILMLNMYLEIYC